MRSKTYQVLKPRHLVRRVIGKSPGHRPGLCSRHVKTRRSHVNILSVLRHELRSPLAGVLGMSELLRNSGLVGEQHQFALALQASGRQMKSLVERMAMAETSPVAGEPVKFEVFNGLELLEQVTRAHWPAAVQKGIGLYLDFDHRLSVIWRSDAAQLRQLLDNLLANAIKFTHQGHVLVEARPGVADRLGKHGVELSVRDTGIGIFSHDGRQIYSICEQGSAEVSHRYGGSGLGLFVCDRIARALGGSVTHRNSAQGGTCFKVELPDLAHSKQGTAWPLRPALISGLRIQIGLDRPANRVVAHLLRRLGVQVELLRCRILNQLPVHLDAVICHPEHISASIPGIRPEQEVKDVVLLSHGFSPPVTESKNESEGILALKLPQPMLLSNLEPLVLRLALHRAMQCGSPESKLNT